MTLAQRTAASKSAAKSMTVTKQKNGANKMNQMSGIYLGKGSTYGKKATTTNGSAIKTKKK